MIKYILIIIVFCIYLFQVNNANAQFWPQPFGIMGDSRAFQIGVAETQYGYISRSQLNGTGSEILDYTAISSWLMAYNKMGGTSSYTWLKECEHLKYVNNWATFISLGGNDMRDAYEYTRSHYGVFLSLKYLSNPKEFIKNFLLYGYGHWKKMWWLWNMQVATISTTNNMEYIMTTLLNASPFNHVLLNDVAPVVSINALDFSLEEFVKVNMFMGLLNARYQYDLVPKLQMRYPGRVNLVVTAPYFWNNLISYPTLDPASSYYIQFEGTHFNDNGMRFWGERIALSLLNNGWFPPNPAYSGTIDNTTGPPSSPIDTTPPTFNNLQTSTQVWMNQLPLVWGFPIDAGIKIVFQVQDDIGIQKVEGATLIYYDETTNTLLSNSYTLRNYQVELDPNVAAGLHSFIVRATDSNNNVKLITFKYLKEITGWFPWASPWGLVIVYNMKFSYWVE